MSHFTVLVIDSDPESQLAPFDENIEVDEYVTGRVTKDDKARFMDYFTEHADIKGLSFPEAYAIHGEDWNGNTWRIEDRPRKKKWKCKTCGTLNSRHSVYCGQEFFDQSKGCGDSVPERKNPIWLKYSTYNPLSKWDWYELGGRWMGYFRLKDGTSGALGSPGAFDNEARPQTADAALKRRH